MKTVTKEYQVYNFEELDKEIQKKVIEKDFNEFRIEINNEFFCKFANEILCLLGFDESEVWYSLGWCQGDGLTFDFNLSSGEIIEIIKQYQDKKTVERGFKFLENIVNELHDIVSDFELNEELINDFDVTINTEKNSYANHYSHKKTRYMNLEVNNLYRDITNKESLYFGELENVIKSIYYKICDILEKEGYEQIYYKPSIEEYTEISNENNYMYLENGELFTE